jgi:LPS sulfotransferase NodH
MPQLIVIAGMHRSGSTWLYNVTRYACINAGKTTYGDFINSYREWSDLTVADVHVIKAHLFIPELCDRADAVLATVRDLRDAVASMVRRGLIHDSVDDVAECARSLIDDEYAPWRQWTNLELKYEDIIRDRTAAAAQVLDIIGLAHLDAAEVVRDVDKLNLRVLRTHDRVSQLHPDHITDGRAGGFRATLSLEAIRAIESTAADWLKEHGYDVLDRTGTPAARHTEIVNGSTQLEPRISTRSTQ